MKIEIFFDYACPYCSQAHHYLKDACKQYNDTDLIWKPCEAHPRPETSVMHSDMAIQGMYFIRDHHGDLTSYHDDIYRAVFEKHQDISDIAILAGYAACCGVDKAAFQEALDQNFYAQEVLDGNIYAWRTCGLAAVPSYRSGSLFLGSRDGIPVSRKELYRFFESIQSRPHKQT